MIDLPHNTIEEKFCQNSDVFEVTYRAIAILVQYKDGLFNREIEHLWTPNED